MEQIKTEWMQEALKEAEKAAAIGEVPVGAVIVDENGEIIVRAHNLRETTGDPTAHAEILALREAAKIRKHWRLTGMTLCVTLEPCTMCAGAIVLSRLTRLVYGASDPKAGASGSVYDLVRSEKLNHKVEVYTGIMAEECGKILKDFFKARRDG